MDASRQNENSITFSFEAIGTSWIIDVYKTLSPQDEGVLLTQIKNRIKEFDLAYSRFKPDSLVSRMSKHPGNYKLPSDAHPMFELYEDMYKMTRGAFTPLIGNTLHDTGYDAVYSFRPKPQDQITPPPTWQEAIEFNHKSNEILIKKESIILDFGGIGKGYLIDIIGELLKKSGINSFLIDAGGDILHINNTSAAYKGDGNKYKNDANSSAAAYHTHVTSSTNHTIRVGLEHPADKTKVIGVVEIKNQAICASAGNRRAWANYHHIINPHTLSSPTEILATWVIAKTTIIADTLATCLFFEPAETFLNAGYEFEYLIIYPDFSIKKSDGFKAELFTL